MARAILHAQVNRQRIPTTSPVTPSISIQSPMRHVLSSCSEMPPSRLPNVDCIAKAIAAPPTAVVAMMLVRFTPTASSLISVNPTSESAMLTSPTMRGTAFRASSTLTKNVMYMRMMPSATISRQISRGTTEIARCAGMIW